MILVDFSQISLASIVMAAKSFPRGGSIFDENVTRHHIFNSVRQLNLTLGQKYGEMIICCDSQKGSWRKKYFPHYKANRKAVRDNFLIDWELVKAISKETREAIRDYFPMKMIEIDGVEADDVIASIVKNDDRTNDFFETSKPNVIVSRDKDFFQLHSYDDLHQYDNIAKKFITKENAASYLWEHIAKGDTSDGVPNILSDDDSFVNVAKRQTTMRSNVIDIWMKYVNNIDGFLNDLPSNLPKMKGKEEIIRRNYDRNSKMIAFSRIPSEIEENVKECLNKEQSGSMQEAMMYMASKGLRKMAENLQDFRVYR